MEKIKRPLSKKTKTIIIVSSILGFLLLSYFGGGLIAGFSIMHAIFDHRLSYPDYGSGYPEGLMLRREEYPSLADSEHLYFKRTEPKGDDIELHAYLHKGDEDHGLVIFAHGIESSSNGDLLPVQSYFADQGYSVMAVDLTASGASEGEGINGLHIGAYDVAAAVDAIKDSKIGNGKIFGIGHSWGAYSVAAATGLRDSFDGVVTFAAFDRPDETMVQYAKRSVGSFLVTMSKPIFALTLNIRSKGKEKLSAVKSLNGSHTPCLCIQGSDDESIPAKSVSLYSKREKVESLEPVLRSGRGHNDLWWSSDTVVYRRKVDEWYRGWTGSEAEFIATIDKARFSAVDLSLMQKVGSYLSAI